MKLLGALLLGLLSFNAFAYHTVKGHGQWVALYGTVDCTWLTQQLQSEGLQPAEYDPIHMPGRCLHGFAFEKVLDTKFSSDPGAFKSRDLGIHYWATQIANTSVSPNPTFLFQDYHFTDANARYFWQQAIGYAGSKYKIGEVQWDVQLDGRDPVTGGVTSIGEKKIRVRKDNCWSNCDVMQATMGASATGTFAPTTGYADPYLLTPKYAGAHKIFAAHSNGAGFVRPFNAAMGDQVVRPAGSFAAKSYNQGDFQPLFWFYVPDLNVVYDPSVPFSM